jgi:hypothetical protein
MDMQGVSLSPHYPFFKCRKVGTGMQENFYAGTSPVPERGPSLVPEYSSTGLRYRMPKCRCRRHRTRCRCPAMVKYGVISTKYISALCAQLYTHWLRPHNPPPPAFVLILYTRALLVSQDRRHLCVGLGKRSLLVI